MFDRRYLPLLYILDILLYSSCRRGHARHAVNPHKNKCNSYENKLVIITPQQPTNSWREPLHSLISVSKYIICRLIKHTYKSTNIHMKTLTHIWIQIVLLGYFFLLVAVIFVYLIRSLYMSVMQFVFLTLPFLVI